MIHPGFGRSCLVNDVENLKRLNPLLSEAAVIENSCALYEIRIW
jgi:hypothetical protein